MPGLGRVFLCCLLLMPLKACADSSLDGWLEQFLWTHRPVVLFTPSANNPTYQSQLQVLNAHREGVRERDVVLIEVIGQDFVKLNGEAQLDLTSNRFRRHFAVGAEFTFLLIGKDGTEKLRENSLVSVDTLFSTIDAMPMRQREMQRGE